jgi:hypothetical protein
MNRRIQLWEEVVYQEVIDLNVQLEIDKASSLTPELFTAMKSQIGSVTGTELMRKLGILPPKEERKPRETKSAKARIEAKTKLVESLLEEIKKLISGDELKAELKDKKLIDGYLLGYRELETAVVKFKTLEGGIIQVPDFSNTTAARSSLEQ